jgi:hypothetical protein
MAAGALCCLVSLPLNWLFMFQLGWGLHGSIAATIIVEAAYLLTLLCAALAISAAATPDTRWVGRVPTCAQKHMSE